MNREIKFRAWQKHHKYMFKPDYIDFVNNDVIIGENDGDNRYENIPLMQYTGLKDKNGKEIFEGDICKVTYYNHSMPNSEIIQVVNYDLGTFSLKKQNSVSELEDDRTNVPLYYCFAPNKIEVIGNIYENHELLK